MYCLIKYVRTIFLITRIFDDSNFFLSPTDSKYRGSTVYIMHIWPENMWPDLLTINLLLLTTTSCYFGSNSHLYARGHVFNNTKKTSRPGGVRVLIRKACFSVVVFFDCVHEDIASRNVCIPHDILLFNDGNVRLLKIL